MPVILVGTPKAVKVLQGDFRQARRGVGLGGDMVCDRIQKNEVWDLLISSIWHYQWTREETPLTPEISSVLYEETQGIPDLLKKVYAIAQAYAISSGKEEITPYIIRKVAKENLKLVQPMLTALKTGNIREIAKYEDICMAGIDFNDFLTRTKESINLDLRAKEIKKKQNKVKQENLMEEKKEAILKLIDLGIDAKKAQKIIDNMLSKSQNVSADGMKVDSMVLFEDEDMKEEPEKKEMRNTKEKNEKQSMAKPFDIRIVVEQGKKDDKSAYESLKEAGYIISFKGDVFSMEVVW